MVEWGLPDYKVNLIDFGGLFKHNDNVLLVPRVTDIDKLKKLNSLDSLTSDLFLAHFAKISFLTLFDSDYVGVSSLSKDYFGFLLTHDGRVEFTKDSSYSIDDLKKNNVNSLVYTIPKNPHDPDFKAILAYFDTLSKSDVLINWDDVTRALIENKTTAVHIHSDGAYDDYSRKNKAILNKLKEISNY